MRKQYVNSISILFAALCFALTACNQGMSAGNGTGTVRISIGGEAARAVDSASGLPVFDEKNTTITVTGEDGTKLAEGTTSVTVEVGIGTKITVKAVVTTAAGVWRGSTEHTVTEGDNPVAVKLSKAPKSVGNILINVNKDGNIANLKLASGASLVSNAVVNMIKPKKYPVTARDSIGRIYVLYEEPAMSHAVFHFKRFDVEGKEDTGFESAITGKLPSGVTLDKIKTMVIDAKTNTVFVVAAAGTNLDAYAVTETTHNTFAWSGAFNLTSLPPITSLHGIEAMAAYNNRLFLVVDTTGNRRNKLFAYKVVLSATAFSLEQEGSGIELNKLRSYTGCTGLFADADGVYCLLSDQNLYGGNLYALGQIVRYQYSGSAFTGETKIGLNPKAAGTDGIPFDAQYFSAPVGFIGSDEEHIYIADDGVNIDTVNENLRVNGNKNRIAAFNRKTNEITFTDTAATWYEEKDGYQFPETKLLLWEKGDGSTYHGMQYWVADTANTPTPVTPADAVWFSTQSTVTPTDVFCYDQDGNLYILYKDNSNYKVRRFALKSDGSYNKDTAQDLELGTPHTISAIAADISSGKNYLYYADTQTLPHTIKRFEWGQSGHAHFSSAEADSAYTITLSSGGEVTALAANKDGVFVGLRTIHISPAGYTLSIKKFTKGNGAPDREGINLIVDAPLYTAHNTNDPYTSYNEAIHDLRIVDGTLYAVTSKLEQKMVYSISQHRLDEFRSSGILYKVGSTERFSGTAEALDKKEAVNPETGLGTGYGFYRFIAVKPRKLVIASDSAWGKGGTNPGPGEKQDTDTVLEYDLATHLASEPENAGGGFSKKLIKGVCDFEWQ